MKLVYKAGIIIGSAWAAFLACSYLCLISSPFPTFIRLATILAVFFSLFTLVFLYQYCLKDIVRLQQKVSKIIKNRAFDEHIEMKQKDETSLLAHYFNTLFLDLKKIHNHFDEKIKDRTKELQNKNIELQKELSERLLVNKTALANKESVTSLSRYDILTSLPNRVFFNEILNKSIQHANRRSQKLAILLIDIDNFKKISNTLGLTKSNLILKEIGKRFVNVLRAEDIIAKLEGDEFILLLNDIGKAKFVSKVAEKLIEVCSHPMTFDTYEFSISCSIGICIYPYDGGSLEDLLKNVDSALYKIKHAGGSGYQFYTHEMDIEAREYIQFESSLRKAIHNNELKIYYQPKLRIKTGKMMGVEALLRWEHPVLGIITPAQFIPIAEETGFIMQICEWTLREICTKTKFWQDEGYEHIITAVNLSPKEFYHPDMEKIIRNALKNSGLHPGYLELEISEKVVMDNIDAATDILNRIKGSGVRLSIDHFGTGYISISHLKTLPFSTLKIDPNFIKGVPYQPNDTAITTAIIGLAHNLGLEVVAAGVETAEQVQYLATQKCDILQGYFLSHPLPAQKIEAQFKNLREEVLI